MSEKNNPLSRLDFRAITPHEIGQIIQDGVRGLEDVAFSVGNRVRHPRQTVESGLTFAADMRNLVLQMGSSALDLFHNTDAESAETQQEDTPEREQ